MKGYVFDFETAAILSRNADLQGHMPLYITCAAGIKTDAKEPELWWAGMSQPSFWGVNYAEHMTELEVVSMLRYLAKMHLEGYPAVTWNGVGFEFLELGHETGLWQEVKVLALLHYDLMFQLLRQVGHFVGLDKAERGMGLPGKSIAGMTGYEAPVLWQKQPEDVLNYVSQDVTQPQQFIKITEEVGFVCYAYSRAGEDEINHDLDRNRPNFGSVDLEEWLPVWKVFELPEPDRRGYRNPPPTCYELLRWVLELPPLTPSSPWALQPELKEQGLMVEGVLEPLRVRLARVDESKANAKKGARRF